jgi:hypothetical protein
MFRRFESHYLLSAQVGKKHTCGYNFYLHVGAAVDLFETAE